MPSPATIRGADREGISPCIDEVDGRRHNDVAKRSKLSKSYRRSEREHAEQDTKGDRKYALEDGKEPDFSANTCSVDLSSRRLIPLHSGALYSGSRFVGEQKSLKNSYEVAVDIQHVDLSESFLCGYLHIKGLTSDYPELTTFFSAELIGPKYSFLTGKWEASEHTDTMHWQRFPAFEPYIRDFNTPGFKYDMHSSDFIFMRWKEYFLVPDHRGRILGASFEGFYYICFQKSTGQFSGFYFHNQSEWYQHLSLRHVEESSFPTFEFR